MEKFLFFLDFFLIIDSGKTLNIISVNQQMLYEYIGSVSIGAKSPQNDENHTPPSSGWIVKGKLTVQRQTEDTLAAAVSF